MSGSAFKTAIEGEPVHWPARLYNILAQLAQQSLSNAQGNDALGSYLSNLGPKIKIQNGTANALPRLSILGIGSPLAQPNGSTAQPDNGSSDALNEFIADCVLTCTAPSAGSAGLFVITETAIDAAGLGAAFLYGGPVPIVVNLATTSDTLADVTPGNTTYLTGGSTGSAKILWKPSGVTGMQWCIVGLQMAGGGSGSIPPGQFQYMVYQAVSQNQSGYDFVRAHAPMNS